MIAALWSFQGWALFAPMAGEVRDPHRNMPRAFVLAVGTVAVLYLFVNASYFYALTAREVASVPVSSSVATEMLTRTFGAAAAALMAAGMLVSSFGALHTGLAPAMRVPYAMAKDGLYFPFLGRLSANGVPVRAGFFAAALASCLALTGNYDRLTDYAVFFVVALLWPDCVRSDCPPKKTAGCAASVSRPGVSRCAVGLLSGYFGTAGQYTVHAGATVVGRYCDHCDRLAFLLVLDPERKWETSNG